MSDPSEVVLPEPLSLYDKIMILYPDLTVNDFRLDKNAYILLRDDGDGSYIYIWKHPIYPKPTQEQLDAIVSP